jgi:uncharacterized repeat protein (TIGR03943 family)
VPRCVYIYENMFTKARLLLNTNYNSYGDAIAIGVWGILLLKLWLFSQLYLLIHPNYIWLTVLAGVILLLIAGFKFIQKVRQKAKTNNAHVTLLPPSLSRNLLLITAILGLVIPPRPFTSSTALQRGINDGFNRATPQSFRATNKPETRSLIEWVRTLNIYPEPDAYTGQKVKITGFAVHNQDFPDDLILLSRFVITCCAADVYPVSLPIKLDQSRALYPADKWLEIEGKMITSQINDRRQLVVKATKITPIPEPKNPYDY